jgi:HKD family nuclease
MIRMICMALAAIALILPLTAPGALAATPKPGAIFNNPKGTAAAKARLIHKIVSAIKSSHQGSYIRIAAYSNDRKDVADALIAADRRGVHVQMLLNDNWTSYQTRRLERKLGTDRSQETFVHICSSACRGGKGNLHSKFYLFSHTGTARNVVMMGSTNLTGYGVKSQWNDLYTAVNHHDLHQSYVTIFDQMKRDRKMAHPFRHVVIGSYTTNFYPRYGTTSKDDPIMKRFRNVRCNHVRSPAGINGHTMIRVSMYGWNGDRGVYLAQKMASLSRQGCNVKVMETRGGGRVVRILERGGVVVKTPDKDRNHNGHVDLYTHEKWMILSGRYGGKTGWHVWTGSQNWSDRAFNGDEVTMHIPRRGVFWSYRENFQELWKKSNSHYPKV